MIDKEEIDEAFKMAEEDLVRERAGSPRFEYNEPQATPIGTPATPAFRAPLPPLDISQPSTSGISKRTIRQPSVTTLTAATPSKRTRQSSSVVFPDSDYGGTTTNGQQFFGRLDAHLGSTRIRLADGDGNCFFQ